MAKPLVLNSRGPACRGCKTAALCLLLGGGRAVHATRSRSSCCTRPDQAATRGQVAARPSRARSGLTRPRVMRGQARPGCCRARPDQIWRPQSASRPDLAAEPHGQILPAMLVGDGAGHRGVWWRGHPTCTVEGRRRQFLKKKKNGIRKQDESGRVYQGRVNPDPLLNPDSKKKKKKKKEERKEKEREC
jgi:hypothetical protein